MKRALLIATLTSALVFSATVQDSRAQENLIYEIRGGALAHDRAVFARDPIEGGVNGNGEIAFRRFGQWLGGAIRPVIGATVAPGDRTSFGYADLRWEYSGDVVFFGFGLGAAVHDGELEKGVPGRRGLGSRALFHIPVELGWQFSEQNRVSLYFEHVSNARLAEPNPGMDHLGVRLAHRF